MLNKKKELRQFFKSLLKTKTQKHTDLYNQAKNKYDQLTKNKKTVFYNKTWEALSKALNSRDGCTF